MSWTSGSAARRTSRVWEQAAAGGFVLVTKDQDFQRLSVLRGAPPKVIWIRLGNCTTADIVRVLRFRRARVAAFAGSAAELRGAALRGLFDPLARELLALGDNRHLVPTTNT